MKRWLWLLLLLAAVPSNAINQVRASVQVTSLTDTAQALASVPRSFSGFVINGGAAAEIVIFRAVADTPEYFRVNVPIATAVIVPLPLAVGSGGLEVITASAAGDVTVAGLYYVSLQEQ